MGRYGTVLTVALVQMLCWAVQVGAQVKRQPYLQVVNPAGVVVRWDTDSSIVGKVHYGISAQSLVDSEFEALSNSKHEVALTGLSPQRKYYYSVTGPSGGREDQYVITAPAPGSALSARIWVISDFGQAASLSDNARRVQTINVWKEFNQNDLRADFVLSLGDQSEIDTDVQLQENYFNQLQDVLRVSPLFTIAGNHEDNDGEVNYRAAFTVPANAEGGGYPSGTKDYYSFNYGNIHVVGLTVEGGVSIGGAETSWLQNDLAGNASDWLIAFMHRPMHSAGYHKTDGSSTALAQKANWLPVLEAAGVDLILAGHNHCYERSYLLDDLTGNSTSLTDANKIDTTLGRPESGGAYQKKGGQGHQGTIFITCEAGGTSNKATYLTAPFSFTPVVFAGDTYEGSLVIDVHGRDTMNVSFLCDELNLQGNHIWDTFTIVKTLAPNSIEGPGTSVPAAISARNYPNPFNPSTVISFQVPVAGDVRLVVYDMLGREVETLVDEWRGAGNYDLPFSGAGLASGTYVCRLQSGPFVASTKMVLIR